MRFRDANWLEVFEPAESAAHFITLESPADAIPSLHGCGAAEFFCRGHGNGCLAISPRFTKRFLTGITQQRNGPAGWRTFR